MVLSGLGPMSGFKNWRDWKGICVNVSKHVIVGSHAKYPQKPDLRPCSRFRRAT